MNGGGGTDRPLSVVFVIVVDIVHLEMRLHLLQDADRMGHVAGVGIHQCLDQWLQLTAGLCCPKIAVVVIVVVVVDEVGIATLGSFGGR